jgi:glucuronate isomerase
MTRIIDNPKYILRSSEARDIYGIIKKDPIFDIHTHINWQSPFARNAWDILKYHYFTEMAFSQGFSKKLLSNSSLSPKKKVNEIAKYLPVIRTTTPYWWLITLTQKIFGFKDNYIGPKNWEEFYKIVKEKSEYKNWIEKIKQISNIERISLTNSPWEEFDGFKSKIFLPTFRVDSLLSIEDGKIFEQIKEYSKTTITNLTEFEDYTSSRVQYFIDNNACSVAVSLPPNFQTREIKKSDIKNPFVEIIKHPKSIELAKIKKVKAYILNYIAELCREHKIPFQLMIGSKREVYPHGVPEGKDKSEPVSSLDGLLYLLNTYQDVNFPISVVSPTQSQELAECARIFRNVYASGHWWYTNTEKEIENSLTIRLELAPHLKHIGQYSDAYTMELIWPKYDMYRRIESNVFAEKYIQQGKLGIDEAVEIIRERDYKVPRKLMGFK